MPDDVLKRKKILCRMKGAWLVTWEGRLTWRYPNKVAAILPSRMSSSNVKEEMGRIYRDKTLVLGERLPYVQVPRKWPYPGQVSLPFDSIMCGHNPHLWGRKVSNVRLIGATSPDEDELVWEEPVVLYDQTNPTGNREMAGEADSLTVRKESRKLPFGPDDWRTVDVAWMQKSAVEAPESPVPSLTAYAATLRAVGVSEATLCLDVRHAEDLYARRWVRLLVISEEFSGKSYGERIGILHQVSAQMYDDPFDAQALTPEEWTHGLRKTPGAPVVKETIVDILNRLQG